MRIPVLLVVLAVSQAAMAAEPGQLFWEAGFGPDQFKGGRALFPGAPLNGRANADAPSVGVIDSGVRADHPQLAGYLREARDFTGEGLEDELGHGTAVALIALFGHGMEPSFAIVSAKVANRKGEISQKSVIDAIEWVVEKGARIVNLSLGFKGTRAEHETLCAAIRRHGDVLFFAAAGNYGPETEVYPAACAEKNLMSVGATDASGEILRSSGRGEIYAPGGVPMIEEWYYWYEQGQAAAKSRDLSSARMLYEKSIAASPNGESEFQIGLIELIDGHLDEAVARFVSATTIEPALAEAHEMRGVALYLKGDYVSAERFLRTAIDLYPDVPEAKPYLARAHFNLGNTLAHLGRRKEAMQEYEAVKALRPDYPRLQEALRALEK